MTVRIFKVNLFHAIHTYRWFFRCTRPVRVFHFIFVEVGNESIDVLHAEAKVIVPVAFILFLDSFNQMVYKGSRYPMSDTFSDRDISDIQGVGARTYKYVELMVKQSSLDVRRSLRLGQIRSLPTPNHDFQFTVRNAVRTLFAGVETIIGAARFFLEAAEKRKEITLSETDIKFLSSGKIEDKFVAVLTIYSRVRQ